MRNKKNKNGIEDALTRPAPSVFSGAMDDFGINDSDLPEVEDMSGEQVILDSRNTKTVTEERQRMVAESSTSMIAIIGMIAGILVVALGLVVYLELGKKIGLNMDKNFGILVLVLGFYMLISFALHIKHKEYKIENYTVEKKVPVDGPVYSPAKAAEREEIIDSKVNEMADMFRRLAAMTSELEEKFVANEAATIKALSTDDRNEIIEQAAREAAEAAAEAAAKESEERFKAQAEAFRSETERLTREFSEAEAVRNRHMEEMREEHQRERESLIAARDKEKSDALAREEALRVRADSQRAMDEAQLIAMYSKREEDLKRIEEQQEEERRSISFEKDKYESYRHQLELDLQDLEQERIRMKNEREEIEAERARVKADREAYEEKVRAEEEAKRKAEEERIAAEQRAIEEARLAEEARIAAEKKAEEEARLAAIKAERDRIEKARAEAQKRIDSLGLSASAFAWSSNINPDETKFEDEIFKSREESVISDYNNQ